MKRPRARGGGDDHAQRRSPGAGPTTAPRMATAIPAATPTRLPRGRDPRRRRGGRLDRGGALGRAAVGLERSTRASSPRQRAASTAARAVSAASPRRARPCSAARSDRRPRSAGMSATGVNPLTSASVLEQAGGLASAAASRSAAARRRPQLVGAQVVADRLQPVHAAAASVAPATGRRRARRRRARHRRGRPSRHRGARAASAASASASGSGRVRARFRPTRSRPERLQGGDRRGGRSVGRGHWVITVSIACRTESGIADAVELGLVDAAHAQVDVAIHAVERLGEGARVGARAMVGGQVVAGRGVAQREPAAVEVPLEAQPAAVLVDELERRAVARVRPRPVALDRRGLLVLAAPAGGEAEEARPQRRVGRALARLVRPVTSVRPGPNRARGRTAARNRSRVSRSTRTDHLLPAVERAQAGEDRLVGLRVGGARAAWRRTARAPTPRARARRGRRRARSGRPPPARSGRRRSARSGWPGMISQPGSISPVSTTRSELPASSAAAAETVASTWAEPAAPATETVRST